MKEYITKFLPFEEVVTKKLDDTHVEISGYGNVYQALDLTGDVVEKNAFANSLVDHKSRGTMPDMLFEHDKRKICGKWLEVKEDSYGLFLRGVVNNTGAYKNVVSNIKKGGLTGLSIGFIITNAVRRNNVRYIVQGRLEEVSLVGTPANPFARFFPTTETINHEHNLNIRYTNLR